MEMRRGLLDTPERGALEKAGEERRMPDERRWQAGRTRVRQGYPRIRLPDGLNISKPIVDQECVFGQVQEVLLADSDVRDARSGAAQRRALFDTVRPDPRFAALVERVGLPR